MSSVLALPRCATEDPDKECLPEDYRITRSTGFNLYVSYLNFMGPVPDTILSYNNWIGSSIAMNLSSKFALFYNMKGDLCEFRLMNPYIESPVFPGNPKMPLYPPEAIKNHYTLASKVSVLPVVFLAGTGDIIEIYTDPILAFSMPIPVRSASCRTSSITCDEDLMKIGYDPLDPGGYFIIDGNKMIMPYIEKLRLSQIHYGPPSKKFKFSRANQIFMTNGGTEMMQVVKHPDTGEYLFQISAFGNAKDTGTKILAGKNINKSDSNMLNVISIALVIDYYYFADGDDPRPISMGQSIEKYFLSALKQLMPITSDPLAWNHIYTEFQSTIAIYYRTSREKVIKDLLIWLDVYDKTDPSEKTSAVTKMINQHIFPTVKDKIGKICMLANLTARLLAFSCGVIPPMNLNKWGFRKLDTAAAEQGKHLRLGLRFAMKNLQEALGAPSNSNRKTLQEVILKFNDVSKDINKQMISAFKPQQYKTETRFQTTERLDSNNLMQHLSFANKIHVDVFKKTKSMDLRNVQYTQWFYICPNHTPDNEQCGLVKYKTPSCKISFDINGEMMIRLILSRGLVSQTSTENSFYPTFFNGIHIGFSTGKPAQVEIAMMRRTKRHDGGVVGIHEYTCVAFTEFGHLEIYTNAGRTLRPVVYVDNGELLYKTLGLDGTNFGLLLAEGCAGWIDPLEEEQELAAAEMSDIDRDKRVYEGLLAKQQEALAIISIKGRNISEKERIEDQTWLSSVNANIDRHNKYPIKYCSLHPISQLDLSVSMLVFVEHEQSCRVSYGVKMETQAKSINPVNAQHSSGRFLAMPTNPLIDTGIGAAFGTNLQPSGGDVLTIIMSTKYSQEDAIEMAESVAERFAYTRRYKKVAKLGNSTETASKFGLPDLTNLSDINKAKYAKLTKDGLPARGVYYREGDAIIGMIDQAKGNHKISDRSVFLDRGEKGYVVDIIRIAPANGLFGGSSPEIVKVILDDYRTTKSGDKFATRHGQKYTVGTITKTVDMPFITSGPTEYIGLCPGGIVNPHCIGSRMTAGLLLEMVAGSAKLLDTLDYDGTSFENHKDIMNVCRNIMTSYGHSSRGTVTLCRGDNGEEIIGEIFFGPMYFMKLCHVAEEKIQGAGRSRDNNHQIKKGKKKVNAGAIRFGEQEVWIGLTHGAPHFVEQRTSTYSDALKIIVCRNCFKNAWNITDTECMYCSSKKGFALTNVNFAFKSISNLLLSIGIKITLTGITRDEYIEKLLRKFEVEQKQRLSPGIADQESHRKDDDETASLYNDEENIVEEVLDEEVDDGDGEDGFIEDGEYENLAAEEI